MTGERRKLRVVTPQEPPRLTPQAAAVLLRILLKADARRRHQNNTIEEDQT